MDLDPAERARVLAEEKAKVRALTFNSLIESDEAFQSKMVTQVLKEVEDVESSRMDYYDTIKKIRDMYEGRRGMKKVHPFENAADVKTGLLFSKIDTQHGLLYPQVYAESLMHWIADDVQSIPNLQNNDKFMRWSLRAANFTSIVDDYIYNLLMEGTFVFKVRWDVDFKWVRRRVPKTDKILRRFKKAAIQLAYRIINTEVPQEDYETKYEYVKFEKGVIDCPPIEDVGFPNDSVPSYDENSLAYIWHRTRPRVNHVKECEEKGIFINSSKVYNGKEEFVRDDFRKRNRETMVGRAIREAEGTKLIPASPGECEVELIERYGKVDLPSLGRTECVIFVERSTKTFLGCMPLTTLMRDGNRPWVIAQLIRRKNRMLGKTPAEGVSETEHEVNTIHNQRLDAGTMSIIPPLFYRAMSGTNPELLHIKPGLAIPLDDVNDAKWMQMPNNVLQSFQEEKMLLELSDSIMGVGPLQMGQESPVNRSRSTARGTLAIISQGNQRTSSLAVRLRQPLAKVINLYRSMWAQNIPDGIEDRLLGVDGDRLFPEGLSVEDLEGNFSVILEADPTAGDKQAENENIMARYQMGLQNPLILQNPAALWELTADVFRGSGKLDIEKYLGPKPKVAGIIFGKSLTDEINMLIHGKLPNTRQGDNVYELLHGLAAYSESDKAKEMEPEHKALLQLRIEILKAELGNKAFEMAQQQEGGGNSGPVTATPGLGQQPGMGAPVGASPQGEGPPEPGLPGAGEGETVPGGPYG